MLQKRDDSNFITDYITTKKISNLKSHTAISVNMHWVYQNVPTQLASKCTISPVNKSQTSNYNVHFRMCRNMVETAELLIPERYLFMEM